MSFDWNPVLLKELRPWLRHERASYRLFALALVTAVLLSFGLALRAFSAGSFRGVGQAALLILGFIQWMLCAQAIIPAATSITTEREKHTFEGLISSPLRPERLVRGKVFFPMYVAALAQLALVPVMVGTYLMGGVFLAVVPLYFVLLLLHDAFLAAAGVYFSTLTHRPPRLGGSMLQQTMTKSQLAQQKAMGLWVAMVIPAMYALIGVTTTAVSGAGMPPAIGVALDLLDRLKVLGSFIPVLALAIHEPVQFFGGRLSFWVPALVLHALLAAFFYRLAVGSVQGRGFDRGPGVRLWCAAFTHALFFLLLANLWPATLADAPTAVYAFVIAGGVWLFLILLPALVGGDALAEDREGRWAGLGRAFLRPAEALRHRVGSAPAYVAWMIAPLAIHAALLTAQAPGASPLQLVLEGGIFTATLIVGFGVFGLSYAIRRRSGEGRAGGGGWFWLLAMAGSVLPYAARAAGDAGSLPAAAQVPLQVVAAVVGSLNPFCGWLDIADRALGALQPSPVVGDLKQLVGPLPVPTWVVGAAGNLIFGAVGWLRLRGDWSEPPPDKDEPAGGREGERPA